MAPPNFCFPPRPNPTPPITPGGRPANASGVAPPSNLRIGHLKSDFRLGRNFLRGIHGDAINLLLAATAANLSLWLRRASPCLDAILSRLVALLGWRALFFSLSA